jgi:hypothetical protein
MSTTVEPPEVDPHAGEHDLDEEPPRLQANWHNLVLFGVFVVLALAVLYFFLPRLAGLEDTWNRIEEGNPV